ncbi:MAG: ATP-binding cassette domain-containing protein [Actinobacteria bacterium]|nr:ATP-binding cassette domain-containing protein [Actinomycetota bacterium]
MTVEKVVQIDKLSFSYPDGTQALKDVSLEIAQGEKVALIGANGAGKSTLLLHLNGIFCRNGRVQILGMKLEKRNLKFIRQKVGLVFQNPDDQLFCPTVFDDVAFGARNLNLLEEQVTQRVTRALEAVGLAGFEHHSAFHLSFGEKKRVSIATVLAMDSEILVLDEPTSNLDPRGKKEIVQLLRKIDGTQIIVTHDLGLAKNLCDRVVVLSKGKKVADGNTEEIFHNQAFLESHGLA